MQVEIDVNLVAGEFVDWQIKHRRSRRTDVCHVRNVEELSDVLECVGRQLGVGHQL